MGNFQLEETHGRRSSSMSFAWRWMHENLQLVILLAIVSLALSFMLMVLLNVTAKKEIALVVNGQHRQVETTHSTLQHLLDEQAILVGAHDYISASPLSEIKDGDMIRIDHAVPVHVTADGQTKTVYTTASTVQDVIKANHITISEHDKVFPSPDTAINGDMDIKIVRVEKKLEERQLTVPFQIITKEDPTLTAGKEKLVQKGQEGVVIQKIENIFQDGKLVSSVMVDKTVQNETKDKIVAVGTKKETPQVTVLSAKSPNMATTTKNNITFSYKKVLKNVSLTAYSSEEDGIGTKTASGTRVTEGRTIAVDTKVIPMGWWVYIEGIGFRRAEDRGGAIKGNKIDVYIDSLKEAKRFGRKKGHTVYVIGPNKPEAS